MAGSDVTFEGLVIGSFSGGADGATPLVVTFNASASLLAVQTLVRAVTYENVSATPDTTPRTVEFVVDDGDGGVSAPVTTTVNVAGTLFSGDVRGAKRLLDSF